MENKAEDVLGHRAQVEPEAVKMSVFSGDLL